MRGRFRIYVISIVGFSLCIGGLLYISYARQCAEEADRVESQMDELAKLLPEGIHPSTVFCEVNSLTNPKTVHEKLVQVGARIDNAVLCDRNGRPLWFVWIDRRRGWPKLSDKQMELLWESIKKQDEDLRIKDRDHRIIRMFALKPRK